MSVVSIDSFQQLEAEQEVPLSCSDQDANASTSPAEDFEQKEVPTSRRRPSSKDGCIVADCRRKLNSRYERRYRLCSPHMKAPQFLVSGHLCRWCQKCGKFHPVDDFDGLKKSCRASLSRHNERQKEARLRRNGSALLLESAMAMELRHRAAAEPAARVAGAATPRIFACAASLPPPCVQTAWERSLPENHSLLPARGVDASTPPLASRSMDPQQAQGSGDTGSYSLPLHSTVTTARLPLAPSIEPPPPEIEADIAEAFSAAVHAAANAAFGTGPASLVAGTGTGAATGGPAAGTVTTHTVMLEPSIDAQEAHELWCLGLADLDPALLPPVLAFPLF